MHILVHVSDLQWSKVDELVFDTPSNVEFNTFHRCNTCSTDKQLSKYRYVSNVHVHVEGEVLL